jgi:nucleotide-binding universal stress UspA family protein
MKRFLVATDGSPAARAAVEAAVQLAADQEAAITFLHVLPEVDLVVPAFGPVVAAPHRQPATDEDEALAHAAAVAEEHGVPHTLRLATGVDRDVIADTAELIGADLVALGSNRHGVLGTAFLGSVSRDVLRRTTLPVLIVHPTERAAAAA